MVLHCFNLVCPKPTNPEGMNFCQHCGSRLLLGNRYAGYSTLGGGQSSRTFAAIDMLQVVDRRCIVKGFQQSEPHLAREMENFRREVARLDEVSRHPQIPQMYAYFERGQQQFLVQEWVAGRNLHQQLQEEGTFSGMQIRQLLLDILPVLQLLHDHQLIHRDIKPTNLIRRERDPALALVDFGAVKMVTKSALMRSGTVLGSAEYVAPEQLMGQATFASDLYSLGATCVHLLTGLSPFDLFNTTTGTWHWRSIAGDVSDQLATILDRLLQAAVQDRYQSANQVLDALWNRKPATCTRPFTPTKSPAPPPSSWQCQTTFSIDTSVSAIATVPATTQLICGGDDGSIRVWDWSSQRCVMTIPGQGLPVTAIASTGDGRAIAAAHAATLQLWDKSNGQLIRTFEGYESPVTAIACAIGGELMVSGHASGAISGWDITSGKLIFSFAEHSTTVEAIALSQDRSLLASGSADGSVKLWNLTTRELLRTLPIHAARVSALALLPADSPDEVISGSWDMTIRLRKLTTGAVHQTLSGHLLPVTDLAIAPDQTTLATASHDSTIKLWHLPTGALLDTLSEHTSAVEAVVFTPLNALLSVGKDGTIKLWQSS